MTLERGFATQVCRSLVLALLTVGIAQGWIACASRSSPLPKAAPEAATASSPRASASAQPDAGALSVPLREGDRVLVESNGKVLAATVLLVLGAGRYRVRYDGFGPEWDEAVDEARILGRR